MKALVKKEKAVGLWMEDMPMPEVGSDDVLIRVDRTGICGTDLHIYNWDPWAQKTIPIPMIVGHEFVGEIVEVGSHVSHLKTGMIVSGEGHVFCGRCRNCMAGRRHLCKDTQGIGVDRPGAFAEYISIPKANVWEHPPNINRDFACIFYPFGNAVHTALQFNLLGEDVLITGAGPIGIMATAVCKHAGARYIVVSDPNPNRLNLARQMGATRVMNPLDEKIESIQVELGMKEGFDVGLEMSGNAHAFSQMLENMCHGGKIAFLGIPKDPFPIDWNKVIFNMLTIKGVYGRHLFETWYQMTVMLQAGLDLSPVITHRLSADEFERGFKAMNEGSAAKVILKW